MLSRKEITKYQKEIISINQIHLTFAFHMSEKGLTFRERKEIGEIVGMPCRWYNFTNSSIIVNELCMLYAYMGVNFIKHLLNIEEDIKKSLIGKFEYYLFKTITTEKKIPSYRNAFKEKLKKWDNVEIFEDPDGSEVFENLRLIAISFYENVYRKEYNEENIEESISINILSQRVGNYIGIFSKDFESMVLNIDF